MSLQRSSQKEEPRVRAEVSPRWVRARIGGTTIADSRRARLVTIGPRPRTYAFPEGDVRRDLVVTEPESSEHKVFGRIRDADVEVDGRRVEKAVRFFEEGELAGFVALRWDAADAWYEEDEEVVVHPHDPHHRIDVRRSTRHVVVTLDGERVAESRRPIILFETNLPERYYLPQMDVRLDLLRESDTRTGCPYKGFASYFDVRVGDEWHEDLAWSYRTSFDEALRVQGLLAFFNERVDLVVDGDSVERPRTPWSRVSARRVEEAATAEWE